MSNELTRIVRTGAQALVAFGANLLLMKAGVDLVAVLDYFGFTQEQLANLVFLLVMPLTTAAVGWLERKVHPLFGLLNGPRRQVEYTLAA